LQRFFLRGPQLLLEVLGIHETQMFEKHWSKLIATFTFYSNNNSFGYDVL